MHKIIQNVTVIVMSVAFVLANTPSKTLEVVSNVDLNRYEGKWYEISRYPNRFQNKCVGEVTATYSQLPNNQISVVNECRQANGTMARAEGKARLAEPNGPNSKLEVRFAPSWLSWIGAVWGDYWILDLGSNYEYSVVGSPDRKYLWILSRTPKIDDATYQKLLNVVEAKGFNPSQLVQAWS